MVYLDSFIRGYCHECKKKSKCEKDCDGLQKAINSIINDGDFAGGHTLSYDNICKYCSEDIVPAMESKCIDCRHHMYFTPRGDLHKIAMGD